MGSPEDEPGRRENETQHLVTFSRPFELQTTPVTQALWFAVMGPEPAGFKPPEYKGADLPIENVNWDDTQAFLRKLNQLLHTDSYRLPTEAEWEYAARAGTTTAFWTGNRLAPTRANYDYMYGQTTPVKHFAPNPWGLYDMAGNVLQWVQDWYGNYPDAPVTDPHGPTTGSMRVARGGSWGFDAADCRSASRSAAAPGDRSGYVGFRLARSAGYNGSTKLRVGRKVP